MLWKNHTPSVISRERLPVFHFHSKPKHTVIVEAGGIAALLRATQRLRFSHIINEVSPKREQGPTLGHYIILAALNRAFAPLSKLVAIGNWYEQSILHRLWRFDK